MHAASGDLMLAKARLASAVHDHKKSRQYYQPAIDSADQAAKQMRDRHRAGRANQYEVSRMDQAKTQIKLEYLRFQRQSPDAGQ